MLPLHHVFCTEKEEYLRFLHFRFQLRFDLAPERIDRLQWFDIPPDRDASPLWD
jgi:hypothetical protein